MINTLKFLGLFLLLNNTFASESMTYKTTRGHVFTKVNDPLLGPSWLAPNGVLWSRKLNGKYSNKGDFVDGVIVNSEAALACKKLNAILPFPEDFQTVQRYFYPSIGEATPAERRDIFTIFPDLKYENTGTIEFFWTGDGDNLSVRYIDHLDFFGDLMESYPSLNVICIRR